MTMEPKRVEVYYSIGSRYSYLALTQLPTLAADCRCSIVHKPVQSAAIYAARGTNPFVGAPVSGQYDREYRQADAEAWADYYGVPYSEPDMARFDALHAALACIAAEGFGVVEPFSRALFDRVYGEGIADIPEKLLVDLAAECGIDKAAYLLALAAKETAETHAARVEEAVGKGVFGVPTFVVGETAFWGNDRLPLLRHHLRKRGKEGARRSRPRRALLDL